MRPTQLPNVMCVTCYHMTETREEMMEHLREAHPAPTAPCTHPRCNWQPEIYNEPGYWAAFEDTDFDGSYSIVAKHCPDCGARLPESGPRKVVGLWPEAVDAIRSARYKALNDDRAGIAATLQSILDAAGEQ